MRILLTSIGRRVELIEHLKKENYILGVDSSDLNPARYFVDDFEKIPKCEEEEYIDTIFNLIDEYNIDILIPLYEREFFTLDKYRDEIFKSGCLLLLSDLNILRVTNDKLSTFEFFNSNNIDSPITFKLDSSFKSRDKNYPLILKPRVGMGSKGIEYIKNENEMEKVLKNIELYGGYLVQEVIIGREITTDVFCDLNGKVLSIVPRERLEVRGGEVSKGRVLRDRDLIDIIYNMVDLLVKKIGLIKGPINIQCILDDFGQFKFIEINPRFGGGVPLSFKAGANYSSLLNRIYNGENIDTDLYNIKEVTMLRFDKAVYLE